MPFPEWDPSWRCEDCKCVIKIDIEPTPPPPSTDLYIWVCRRGPRAIGVAPDHWCFDFDEVTD